MCDNVRLISMHYFKIGKINKDDPNCDRASIKDLNFFDYFTVVPTLGGCKQ